MTEKKEKQEYTIKVTEHQAQVIRDACELYSRVCMEQWQEAFHLAPLKKEVDHGLLRDDLRSSAKLLSQHLVQDIDGSGSFLGIGHKDLSDKARTAYDVHQVVRKRLAWDEAIEKNYVKDTTSPRDFTTMLGVQYDEAMRYGKDNLPVVYNVKKVTL